MSRIDRGLERIVRGRERVIVEVVAACLAHRREEATGRSQCRYEYGFDAHLGSPGGRWYA